MNINVKKIFSLILTAVIVFSSTASLAAPKFKGNTGGSLGYESGAASDGRIVALEKSFGGDASDVLPPIIGSSAASSGVNASAVTDSAVNSGNTASEKLPAAEDILSSADKGGTIEAPAASGSADGNTVIPIDINTTVRDSLPKASAVNIYTFETEERGALAYGFNHIKNTGASCLWRITLYEEYSPDGTGNTTGYREINSISYSTAGTAAASPVTGLLPGKYRVRVECFSGYTDEKFDLMVGFAASERYETECNDEMSRYTYLPLNKTLTGSSGAKRDGSLDVDWYMFRITGTGYAALYFSHGEDKTTGASAAAIAWKITVVDFDGNEYFYTVSSLSAESLNSGIMGLPEGYYFVKISSHTKTNIAYELTVSFSEDGSIEREYNDSPETATPIGVNTQLVGSLTQRDGKADKDYYGFTLKNDGFVVVNFVHEALAEDKDGWNVKIISESGQIVYSAVSKWNQAALQSPYVGLSAGEYFILIDSDNIYRNSSVYRLTLLTTNDGSWETEPNGTPETADIIEPGKSVNGATVELGVDYDKDYYTFSVATECIITVSFDHIIRDGAKEGWRVHLLDENLNTLRTVASDWNESQKTFIYKTVQPGKYYVLVETGLYFTGDRYSLTVSVN